MRHLQEASRETTLSCKIFSCTYILANADFARHVTYFYAPSYLHDFVWERQKYTTAWKSVGLITRVWRAVRQAKLMFDDSRGTLRLARDALGDERVPSLSLPQLKAAYRTGSGRLRSWTTAGVLGAGGQPRTWPTITRGKGEVLRPFTVKFAWLRNAVPDLYTVGSYAIRRTNQDSSVCCKVLLRCLHHVFRFLFCVPSGCRCQLNGLSRKGTDSCFLS